MKRGGKLLLLVCVLAVLVGGYFVVVKIVANTDTSAATAGAAETVSIAKPAKDDVVELSYTYQGEAITLKRADSSSDWVYADNEAFPLDQTYPGQMLAVIDALSPTRSFTGDNMSDYGLDEPAITVTATTTDGTAYTYALGSMNDVTEEYYLTAGSDGTVYTVDSSLNSAFSYTLLGLVLQEDVPQVKDVQSIDVTSNAGTVSIVYDPDAQLTYSDNVVWYSKENGETLPLGSQEVQTLINNLNALTWRSCVSYNADESMLATYGLDNPAATISIRYMADVTTATGTTDENGNAVSTTTSEERTYTLELGSYVGDYCYARIEGSGMVYTIDATTADEVMLAGYQTLRSDLICAMDFDTVSSMDVTIDGITHTLTITPAADEDSEATYTLDGQAVDADSAASFTGAITGLTWNGGTAEGSAESTPEVTIVFHRTTSTFTTMELDLVRHGSTEYRVSFAGTDSDGMLVDTDGVDALTQAFNAMLA